MLRNLLIGLLVATVPMSASMAQSARPRGSEPQIREIQAGFDEMDRNHDGKVSRIEMTAYGHSKGIRGMVDSKAWKQMDADRNGWISKEEFTSQMLRYSDQRKR